MRGDIDMKKFLILLCILATTSLVSCSSSDSRLDDIESRLSNIESKLNISTKSNNSNNSIDSTISSNSDTNYYDLSDMSVENIVSECEYYAKNLPKSGTKYEDWYNILKHTPITTNKLTATFVDDYSIGQAVANMDHPDDIINGITINGYSQEMDGTITIKSAYICISLTIKDYDKAKNLYNALEKSMNTFYNNKYKFNTNKENMYWTTETNASYIPQVLSMIANTDTNNDQILNYVINITYYSDDYIKTQTKNKVW